MLSVAVHGVTKNVLVFVYFFFLNNIIVSKCKPKLMSCGQLKIIGET